MRVAGAVTAWLMLPLLLGACTGEENAPRRVEPPPAVVVVASFDFPESEGHVADFTMRIDASGVAFWVDGFMLRLLE